jgi:hypothetical protein
MSNTLSAAAIASFDAEVKHAYQGAGKLRPTVRLRTGIVGSTHRFPNMGKGTATVRVPQTDVVPMNIAHTNQTATLEDWNAPEYTDIFQQAKVNFDEQSELAKTIAGAIGRREDQLILDALDAASTTLTVSDDIGGTNTGMNTAKLRRAKKLLDDQGVESGKGTRSFVISAEGLEQLLGTTEATSSDFAMVKSLVDGEISYWLGFDFTMIETRSEGGLPKVSTARTSYAYAKSAIGLAVGIDFRTEVNYIPHKTSWLANGLFSAGSVAIDALGIVEVATVEVA